MNEGTRSLTPGRSALWTIWCCLFCVSATGCFRGTTTRTIHWPGVTAFGHARGQATDDSEFEFDHLRLRPQYLTGEHGVDGLFVIEMPDGKVLAVLELDRDLVEGYCDKRVELNRKEQDDARSPDEAFYTSLEFEAPKYIFDFEHGDLIKIVASIPARSSPRDWVPAIGDRGGARMYRLPLTYEQLVELLGEPQHRWEDRFAYF